MTKEEAIKFLTLMRKAVSNFEEYGHDKASMVIECDKAEAIDMAIEALSADAEPKRVLQGYCKGANTIQTIRHEELQSIANTRKAVESADAVSRDGVIAYVCDGRKCGGNCDECGRTTDIEHAMNFTRISDSYFERLDSIAVVRCKDCRHSRVYQTDSKGTMQTHCVAFIMSRTVTDDDFCSWGERREK